MENWWLLGLKMASWFSVFRFFGFSHKWKWGKCAEFASDLLPKFQPVDLNDEISHWDYHFDLDFIFWIFDFEFNKHDIDYIITSSTVIQSVKSFISLISTSPGLHLTNRC